jgi:hypothetical protein
MEYSDLSAQINNLFSQGKNATEIAKILGCAKSMVRYHTDAIFKKKSLEQKKSYKKRIRSAKKKKAIQLFGSKCQICDYNKCQNSLNFHHIDPSLKKFEISNAFCRDKISDEEVAEELKKCILICANCHNEIHAGITEIPENVKNPLTNEENVVGCTRSLEVVISADGESEEKAENPLTIQQIVLS